MTITALNLFADVHSQHFPRTSTRIGTDVSVLRQRMRTSLSHKKLRRHRIAKSYGARGRSFSFLRTFGVGHSMSNIL